MSAKKAFQARAHGKDECEVEGCTREAAVCGMCAPCYSADYYWSKKGAPARRHRREQLLIFTNRMERLVIAQAPWLAAKHGRKV
jgi:hypothetical protein